MASDLPGLPPVGWMTPLVGVLSAALGAFGLWLANRMLGKAAFQTAINSGFKELTDQLQEERKALRAEMATERLSYEIDRTNLRGEVRQLRQIVESLEALLRANGIAVPARPQSAAPLEDLIEIKGGNR